jgi:hypothetical protein
MTFVREMAVGVKEKSEQEINGSLILFRLKSNNKTILPRYFALLN